MGRGSGEGRCGRQRLSEAAGVVETGVGPAEQGAGRHSGSRRAPLHGPRGAALSRLAGSCGAGRQATRRLGPRRPAWARAETAARRPPPPLQGCRRPAMAVPWPQLGAPRRGRAPRGRRRALPGPPAGRRRCRRGAGRRRRGPAPASAGRGRAPTLQRCTGAGPRARGRRRRPARRVPPWGAPPPWRRRRAPAARRPPAREAPAPGRVHARCLGRCPLPAARAHRRTCGGGWEASGCGQAGRQGGRGQGDARAPASQGLQQRSRHAGSRARRGARAAAQANPAAAAAPCCTRPAAHQQQVKPQSPTNRPVGVPLAASQTQTEASREQVMSSAPSAENCRPVISAPWNCGGRAGGGGWRVEGGGWRAGGAGRERRVGPGRREACRRAAGRGPQRPAAAGAQLWRARRLGARRLHRRTSHSRPAALSSTSNTSTPEPQRAQQPLEHSTHSGPSGCTHLPQRARRLVLDIKHQHARVGQRRRALPAVGRQRHVLRGRGAEHGTAVAQGRRCGGAQHEAAQRSAQTRSRRRRASQPPTTAAGAPWRCLAGGCRTGTARCPAPTGARSRRRRRWRAGARRRTGSRPARCPGGLRGGRV